MSSKARIFRAYYRPDMGCVALPCQAGMVAWTGPNPYIPASFPIITDDLLLRPTGGRSLEEILPWQPQHR
jgi:hypothetical protein